MPDFVFTGFDPIPTGGGLGLLGVGSWNGLSWGTGNGVTIDEVSGLHDMPDIINTDHERPNDHGMFIAKDYLSARIFHIGFRITGTSVLDFQDRLNMVSRALVSSLDEEHQMLVFDNQRTLKARCRRRQFLLDPKGERRMVTGRVMAEFIATDPRLYDVDITTVTSHLSSDTSGVTFPVTFPLTFGTSGRAGTSICNNIGWFETRPIFKIYGPCTNPQIIALEQQAFLGFAINLGPSDFLYVNTLTHSVILNGEGVPGNLGASRRNTLVARSEWFNLPPGITSIEFVADSFESGAQLATTYQSAWV